MVQAGCGATNLFDTRAEVPKRLGRHPGAQSLGEGH